MIYTAKMAQDLSKARVTHGILVDRNLQQSMGPAGVSAVNSRIVAERLVTSATDDIRLLCAKGTLRCCNCGLAVTDSMKLPIRDPHDSIARTNANTANTNTNNIQRDWVRVPLDYDDMRPASSMEFSDYVACTPPCALRFMYDSCDFIQSHVPHIFNSMMWLRHRQDEPVNAAPPADCLAYVYRWQPQKQQTRSLTTLIYAPSRDQKDQKAVEVGLSASSFYWILANAALIAYKQMAPMYIPPLKDELNALANKDDRFTQYYYQESSAGQVGPPQVGAKMPAHKPANGIRLDANPDADNETDFATDTIHPPHILAASAAVATDASMPPPRNVPKPDAKKRE